VTGFSVSPGGKLVAFSAIDGVYVMSMDGSWVTKLFDERQTFSNLSWEPLPISADATATLTPTITPTPTASPTIPTATPLSLDDVGGGTGEILFYEVGTSQNPGGYHIFSLRDESFSDLNAGSNAIISLEVQWAADGNHLLVTQSQTETVFTLPIDRSVEEIELSPEGSMLAFTDKDLNDQPQLWVIQVSSGEVRHLTNVPRGVISG
jgi:hypothetical protein